MSCARQVRTTTSPIAIDAVALNREGLAAWAMARWQVLAFGGIVLLATVLRLWDLDRRAFHFDEVLFSHWSWLLFKGEGFEHVPDMHGPLEYELNALMFVLFGDSDFTARLGYALFGIGLVALPWLLRKQLGMTAVLIASLMLAVSPTMVFFSRFAHEDIEASSLALAVVVCIWRYLDEQKVGWLYGLAAAMALSFATKETAYLINALLLVFIDVMLAIELGKRRPGEQISDTQVWMRTALIAPIAWAIAALWPYTRRWFQRDSLPPAGDVLIVIGTLTLPQLAAATQLLPLIGNSDYKLHEDDFEGLRVGLLLAGSAGVGLLWSWRRWPIVAACFFVPFTLLYTTFLFNIDGFWSGIWSTLDFWLSSGGGRDLRAGHQTHYYYPLLTGLYEFLPVLIVLGGGIWLARRGASLGRWLLFWLAGVFIALSTWGENSPWLATQIAVPLILSAAMVLAGAIQALQFSAAAWRKAAMLATAAAIATLLIVTGDTVVADFVGIVLAMGVLIALGLSLRPEGRRGLARGVLVASVAALFTLTVRASLMASFMNANQPVEMFVHYETGADVVRIRNQIDALAERSGRGRDLPIYVDALRDLAWPWTWYLRNYRNVQTLNDANIPFTTNPQPRQAFRPPANGVALIHGLDMGQVDATGFERRPYAHSVTFPEEGWLDMSLSKAMDVLTSPQQLNDLGHFFLYRMPKPNLGPTHVGLFPAGR